MLCQYRGCDDTGHCTAGSTTYALSRLGNISLGCLFPLLINHLIAPWYLSTWALGNVANSFSVGSALLTVMYGELRGHILGAGKGPDSKTDTGGVDGRACGRGAAAPDGETGARGMDGDGSTRPATEPLTREADGKAGAAGLDGGDVMGEHGPDVASASTGQPSQDREPDTKVQHVHQYQPHVNNQHLALGMQPQPQPEQQPQTQPQSPPPSSPHSYHPSQPGDDARTSPSRMASKLTSRDAPGPKPTLQAVLSPLSEALVAVAREGTVWQRGLLSTPHAVHAMLAAGTLLADRLAAMQVLKGKAGTLACMSSQKHAT